MKRFVFLITIHVLALLAKAQEPKFEWARNVGEIRSINKTYVEADRYGNVYVSGCFDSTVDFDPGKDSFNLTSGPAGNIFLLKLDVAGNFKWAKQFGNGGVNDIAVDKSGNIYITGYYMPPNYYYYYRNQNTPTDIFIYKIDSAGNFIWSKYSQGWSTQNSGLFIEVDASDNIYVAGQFEDSLDFNFGKDLFKLSSNDGVIFILKLNKSGNFVWVKNFGGSGSYNCGLSSLRLDKFGNIYFTGFFSDYYSDRKIDFNPDPLKKLKLPYSSARDIYILKLNKSGKFLWAKSIGGERDEYSYAMAVDSKQNVYITGQFDETTDFNPYPGSHKFYLSHGENYDDYNFLLKLNRNGNFMWAKSLEGRAYDDVQLSVNSIGDIYILKSLGWKKYFEKDSSNIILNEEDGRALILKYKTNGKLIWAVNFGEEFHNIFTDKLENVYTTGVFKKPCDFKTGEEKFILIPTNNLGYGDIFIHKLSQPDFNKKSKSKK